MIQIGNRLSAKKKRQKKCNSVPQKIITCIQNEIQCTYKYFNVYTCKSETELCHNTITWPVIIITSFCYIAS